MKYGPYRFDGWVYFVQAIEGGPIKIGWAVDPVQRLRELQTGNPSELVILTQVKGGDLLERALHFVMKKSRLRGEWFVESEHVKRILGVVKEWAIEEDNGRLAPTDLRKRDEAFAAEVGFKFESCLQMERRFLRKLRAG